MRWLPLVVCLAACTSSPSPGDMGGGGGGGGGGGDLAGGGPADMAPRPTAGIACGPDTCTTTAQLCCTSDSGKTGACQQANNPNCGSASFYCDGPEDCEPANPECCVESGFATCRQAGYCATKMGAKVMCHKTADCTAPAQCFNAPNGSPYALCL